MRICAMHKRRLLSGRQSVDYRQDTEKDKGGSRSSKHQLLANVDTTLLLREKRRYEILQNIRPKSSVTRPGVRDGQKIKAPSGASGCGRAWANIGSTHQHLLIMYTLHAQKKKKSGSQRHDVHNPQPYSERSHKSLGMQLQRKACMSMYYPSGSRLSSSPPPSSTLRLSQRKRQTRTMSTPFNTLMAVGSLALVLQLLDVPRQVPYSSDYGPSSKEEITATHLLRGRAGRTCRFGG